VGLVPMWERGVGLWMVWRIGHPGGGSFRWADAHDHRSFVLIAKLGVRYQRCNPRMVRSRVSDMPPLFPLKWSLILLAVLMTMKSAQAQSPPDLSTLPGSVTLLKVSELPYPPMAKAARVAGDVDLMLTVRQDGKVDSAIVVSGPPMLRQPALDSARRSQFACRGCSERVTSYALRYTFRIVAREPPKECQETPAEAPPPLEVNPSRRQVIVSTWQSWTCDPAVSFVSVRSVKCLYLWRCGRRQTR
jgi:Gram-negative bacterial TonB protein C-terminal